ncbi:MAG TPA: O-antigen ligase family protein [Gammaproteobacteria bacterium]
MTNPVALYWRTGSGADKVFAAAILLFFCFIGIDWSVAKNGLYLAVLIALGALIFVRRAAQVSPAGLDRLEWALIAVIVVWIAHSFLSWWVNDMPMHGDAHIKGRQAKLLLFIPLFLFIKRRGVPDWLFWTGALLAALIISIDGLVLFFRNGSLRALKSISEQGEGHYTIQIAVMVATLVAYLWIAMMRYWRSCKPASVAALLASLAGLAFLIASGVRGSWIALAVGGLIILVCSLRKSGAKAWLVFVAISMVLMVSFYQLPFAKHGLERMYTEVYDYFEKDRKTSSTGTRFELWKASVVIAKKQPVFGAGPGRFTDAVAQEFPDKKWLQQFEYPHNQYFAALGSRGFPGLILLLLLLALPGFVFWKGLRDEDETRRHIAFAGLMLITIFAISGLTYDHLEKRLQIAFFTVNLALLLGMLKWRPVKIEGESSGST